MNTMTQKLSKYWHVALISYRSRLTYLADIVGEAPIIVLHLWILTQLYTVTYQSVDSSSFEAMTVPVIIWILMLITCFSTAMYPTVSSFIDEEVKSGSLSYSAIRPYSYILFHYMNFLGRTLPAIIINSIVGIIACFFLVGPITVTWYGIFFGLALMFLGYTLDFLIELSIGLLAFWIEDTSSISFIYRNAIQILGGSIIPLSLYPQPLKYLAELLPFSQLFYAPAELMITFSKELFFTVFIIQSAWLLAFGLISHALFRQGMKNVSISGG